MITDNLSSIAILRCVTASPGSGWMGMKVLGKGPFIKHVRNNEGRGVCPKADIDSKGGCVDLVLEIRPKCGQGKGGGPKSLKFCGRPSWMVPKDG